MPESYYVRSHEILVGPMPLPRAVGLAGLMNDATRSSRQFPHGAVIVGPEEYVTKWMTKRSATIVNLELFLEEYL